MPLPVQSTKPSQPTQHRPKLFKYRHFEPEIILLCLRWYLRYSLSYRDLEEIMVERGLLVDHTTIYRWVQRYAPVLEKRCRAKLKPTNDSWHVDETYIKVDGKWCFLYRAIDRDVNLVDSMLSEHRDMEAAKKFLTQAREVVGHRPTKVTTDGHDAYQRAIRRILGRKVEHRTNKYLNNRLEQDHRGIKQRYYPMRGFGSFVSAS